MFLTNAFGMVAIMHCFLDLGRVEAKSLVKIYKEANIQALAKKRFKNFLRPLYCSWFSLIHWLQGCRFIFSHIKKYKRKTRWTYWRGNFFSHRCKVVIPNETVTSETFHWFLPRCYLKTEEIIHSWPRLVVLANFITCSSPEIPRDIMFIPSILKFQQRWRISWT